MSNVLETAMLLVQKIEEQQREVRIPRSDLSISDAVHKLRAVAKDSFRVSLEVWHYSHRENSPVDVGWEIWDAEKATTYKGRTLDIAVNSLLAARADSEEQPTDALERAEDLVAAIEQPEF